MGAVEAGRVGVAHLDTEVEAPPRRFLGFVEPSLPDHAHDVDRGHDVQDRAAADRIGPLAQLAQRPLGPPVTGEVQIDGLPEQAKQGSQLVTGA